MVQHEAAGWESCGPQEACPGVGALACPSLAPALFWKVSYADRVGWWAWAARREAEEDGGTLGRVCPAHTEALTLF